MPTNREISKLLREIAASYIIKNESKYRFQIIAYQKAADSIENASIELSDYYKEKKLYDFPGIGPSIRASIEELFKTGKVKHFDDIKNNISSAVFPLLDIPSFGPKKAYKIVSSFDLKNDNTVIDDVRKLAIEGRISTLPSFGKKSESDILRAIDEYKLGKTKTFRMPLPYAFDIAEKIVDYMKQSKDVIEVYPLGSLRRMKETTGDIDIAVSTNRPSSAIEYFINYPNKERIIEKGDRTASIIVGGGKQIDLMVQEPERFGSLLQHFTGSKEHNIALREFAMKRNLSLSEYGIRLKTGEVLTFKKEDDYYHYLGLEFIPPELRENRGEIQVAKNNKLPSLVSLKDIKGDLHIHSNYPIQPSHDLGNNSYEDILDAGRDLGYEYLGFSEHNPSISNHSSEEIYNILLNRRQKIDQLNESNYFIRIINLLEVDILASGELALDDRSMSLLDGAIVSIHSAFSMDEKTMTDRVIKGLSHPKALIFAHPTGRLINQRQGYGLNWKRVFSYIKDNNKAIEINAWPLRLDLPDDLVYEARTYGIKFAINTDSHDISHMYNMKFGLSVARRGWCTKQDIINTLSYKEIRKWIADR
jgi:DNA polymerase (family X)